MLPRGFYKAFVKNWGLGKSSAGNFQFQLKLDVLGYYGEDTPDEGAEPETIELSQRTVFLPITDKTKHRTLMDLKWAGYPYNELRAAYLTPGTQSSYDFSQRALLVHCDHDVWEGKAREKWSLPRPRGVMRLSSNEAEAFDSLFGEEGSPQGVPF